MTNIKLLESKIFTGVIALCSSLLTNTFVNFTSTTDYVLTVSNNKIMLMSVPMSFNTLILNIFHIILTFFITFILLSFFFKLILKIYRKIQTRKIKVSDEQELIYIVDSLKENSINLYEKFSLADCTIVQNSFIKLYLKELNNLILQLNHYFSNPDSDESKKIQNSFRKKTSSYISSITDLSFYELEGLIDLLQFMLNKAASTPSHDTLLKSDCKNMLKCLEDLKCSLTDM